MNDASMSGPLNRSFVDGDILIEKDVPIPLADGHVVYCNVFRPNRKDRVPPIVVFTPYGKDSDVAIDFKRYWDIVLRDHPEVVKGDSSGKYLTWEVPDPERWVPEGYAIVVVDARGTGKSPGFYEMMSPLQTRDYYDAIEWAGTQSWSTGKVGLLGVSYLAIKQWQVAALQPPHLAAIIPFGKACSITIVISIATAASIPPHLSNCFGTARSLSIRTVMFRAPISIASLVNAPRARP